jgi:hypothetical protein
MISNATPLPSTPRNHQRFPSVVSIRWLLLTTPMGSIYFLFTPAPHAHKTRSNYVSPSSTEYTTSLAVLRGIYDLSLTTKKKKEYSIGPDRILRRSERTPTLGCITHKGLMTFAHSCRTRKEPAVFCCRPSFSRSECRPALYL